MSFEDVPSREQLDKLSLVPVMRGMTHAPRCPQYTTERDRMMKVYFICSLAVYLAGVAIQVVAYSL